MASGGFLPTSRLIVLSITDHLVICRTDDKSSSIERESNAGSYYENGRGHVLRCTLPERRSCSWLPCCQGTATLLWPTRCQRPNRIQATTTSSPNTSKTPQKSRILRRIRNIGFSLGTLVQGTRSAVGSMLTTSPPLAARMVFTIMPNSLAPAAAGVAPFSRFRPHGRSSMSAELQSPSS